jgi:RimJ/RimL family protein N-acetyltransferase
MTEILLLRDVVPDDLPIFFEQQRDPEANRMAAFTAPDPDDRAAVLARWQRILANPAIRVQTIVYQGQVAGSVLSFEEPGGREISYWLGRQFWGRGLATRALVEFLHQETTRPLYARAAKDNLASLRVLHKCGFRITGEDRGYANARAAEVDEFILTKD